MASFDGERKSGLSKSDHITVTKLTSFLGTIRFCDFAAFLSHRMAWQNQEGEGGSEGTLKDLLPRENGDWERDQITLLQF